MKDKTKLEFALKFKAIYDQACEELEKVKWWDFRRVNKIQRRARWASHHYSRNMNAYNKSKL